MNSSLAAWAMLPLTATVTSFMIFWKALSWLCVAFAVATILMSALTEASLAPRLASACITGSFEPLAEAEPGPVTAAVARVRVCLVTRFDGPALALMGARMLLGVTLGREPSDDISVSASTSSAL